MAAAERPAPAPPRARRQIMWQLLLLCTGLCLVFALGGWWWVDRQMRRQAEASAGSIVEVLSEGGFAWNEQIRRRMATLTGYRFERDPPPGPAPAGSITRSAGAHTVRVHYQTPAYQRARREVVLVALLAWGLGTAGSTLLAWLLARRHARPLEDLAEAARRLGSGSWEEAVPPSRSSAEIAALSADLEGLRRRLHELTAQQRQAERLATLGTFTATIAHEVRNPLSAVQLSIQLLQRRLGADEHLELVRDELERLELTVDELLAYSRGMDVRLTACDLRAIATDVCRLLRRQAQHAGVELRVQGAGRVQGDPQRLRQLLLNLVLNAIQAQYGGGQVEISVLTDGLAVRDQGPGVPEQLRGELFQAFSSRRAGGSGLGLHLAAQIAAAHEAELVCLPEEPRAGACFQLRGLRAAD